MNSMLRYIEQKSAAEAFRWGFSNMEIDLKKKKMFSATDYPPGSAAVIIIEDGGMLLAVSRKHDHFDLGLPGGKIEAGESPISAAAREAVEEIGRPVCNPMLLDIAEVNGIAVFIYRAEPIGNISDCINDEGARVCWVSPSAICKGTFGKFNKKYIMPLIA